MKKYLSLLLCFAMLFAFSACAKNANKSTAKTEKNTASTTQTATSSTSSSEENPDGLIPGVNTNEVTSDTLICIFPARVIPLK